MSNPTVSIPQERLPELEEAIARLNRKADKLYCPPISVELGDTFEKKVSPTTWATYVPVTIHGEAPKLNGWVFVATLEHDENGTLIRRLPAFDNEVDLSQYRKATPDNCDHCGYKRRRNDTYVVAYRGFPGEDHIGGYDRPPIGTTKQVGSSCLKDFIGHENPEAIARHLQSIRDFIESVQGGTYEGGRITPRYDLESVVAVSIREIDTNGYVSRKKSRDEGQLATAESVRTHWHQFLSSETERVETQKYFPGAQNLIKWVRSLSEDDLENEYLYNLFTVYKGDSITESQFGIAASGLVAYNRANPQTGDGDRQKGHVTHTEDEPTEKQLAYIEKLAEKLDSPYDPPETRQEASDLINTMKAALQMMEDEAEAHREAPATDKQLGYINKLMGKRIMTDKQRKEARTRIDSGLTRKQASVAIDWLQGLEEE